MSFRTIYAPLVCLGLLCSLLLSPLHAQDLEAEFLSTYSTGIFDDGAAEIVAYDAVTQRVFFVNAANKEIVGLDISDPTQPTLLFTQTLDGGSINSVAVYDGLVAVAIEADVAQDPGSVAFLTTDGDLIDEVTVGALPDALTFTPDGTKVIVANEGEPNDSYSVDPEGSISIIDVATRTVQTAGFTAFNDATLDPSIRIFGPGATVAQDLEPEYIAIDPDGTTAWATLQENNAVAVIDIASATITNLLGLGFKDHSVPGQGLDASDRDDAINIASWPVFGMYQPDAIASFQIDGATYYVTANEGDAREYEDDDTGFEFVEEERIKDLLLDPVAFPDAAALQEDDALGRLTITLERGDTDDDGDFDALYSFGSRSFSIWDASGALVYDSGDELENIVATFLPDNFNSTNDENQSFDNRSDNKGPEPEGVDVGVVGDRIYAFVGLERVGGVVIYDVTNPFAPVFVDYVINRDFSVVFDVDEDGDPDPTPEQLAAVGDLGPEGILLIEAPDSPTGQAILVVSNEVSGTVSFFGLREAALFDLSVELAGLPTLVVPPSEIPPQGGCLAFALTIANLSDEQQDVGVWGEIFDAAGTLVRVTGPRPSRFAPDEEKRQIRRLCVPGSLPPGAYTLAVSVGLFPDEVFAKDSIEFTKLEGASKGAIKTDWSFDLEATDEVTTATSIAFELEANYPNPFNPNTNLRFHLPATQDVQLVVHDLLGREVQVLVDGSTRAGWHTVQFDAGSLPSGLYLARLTADGQPVQVQRMLLVK